jgi:uncharacterized membrane protein/plastocyanin
MNQDIFDWILLLVRWLHITVAVTWIGTSIFFMWLDRSFEFNKNSTQPGHVGDLWMLHGGGFYHVEKLLMGPTKVPEHLHWFKWESYWTWMSGAILVALTYYSGEGTMLMDSSVSNITYYQALAISLFSLIGSWFFYDFVWEREFTKMKPIIGHLLTLAWLVGMSYFLCHTLSGRAAYIHIGGMMGTWMTANVFMRIIPRQLKMVEASRKGEAVNQDWGKNAKNRSTHNTYLTLPVIFVMVSNHFPQTYGHEYNWLILLVISLGGAAIREYFVVRLKNPKRSMTAAIIGIALIVGVIIFSREPAENPAPAVSVESDSLETPPAPIAAPIEQVTNGAEVTITGSALFEGKIPQGKRLNLPAACAKNFKGPVYSNEVIVNNGKLQNVLVRVISGIEGKTFTDIPTKEVELDQHGCMYTPRVVGARVGQKVTFINSDPVFHNVRSITAVNQRFNMAMPTKGQRETKIFNKPETFLQAKCSVHPWMGAYVAVMDHPYFSVTNSQGEFTIKNLPEGKYTIEAWHEVYGTQKQEISVTKNGMTPLTFIFK